MAKRRCTCSPLSEFPDDSCPDHGAQWAKMPANDTPASRVEEARLPRQTFEDAVRAEERAKVLAELANYSPALVAWEARAKERAATLAEVRKWAGENSDGAGRGEVVGYHALLAALDAMEGKTP